MQEEDMELLDEFAELLREHPKYEEYEELPPMTLSQAIQHNRQDIPSRQEFEYAEKTILLITQIQQRDLTHEGRKIVKNFRDEHPVLYLRWRSAAIATAKTMDRRSSTKVTIVNLSSKGDDGE